MAITGVMAVAKMAITKVHCTVNLHYSDMDDAHKIMVITEVMAITRSKFANLTGLMHTKISL